MEGETEMDNKALWFLRKTNANLRLFSVTWVVIMISVLSSYCHSKCDYEAIFNFGDSNTDTGGFYAAFPAQSAPFGMTYFGKPSGRASDGRLIVDFLGNRSITIHSVS